MSISAITAKNLAQLTNIEITPESSYSAITVEEIVKIASSKGFHVKIHVSKYSAISIEKFVKLGGNNVTIVI